MLEMWIGPGAIFLLLLSLLGLLSATEAAYASANRRQIRELARQGNPAARRMEQLLSDPTHFLTAFQTGRILVLVGAGLGLQTTMPLAFSLGSVMVFLCMALLLAAVHVTGRAWSMRDASQCALRLTPVARFIGILLTPLAFLYIRLGMLVQGPQPEVTPERNPFLSEEGLRFLLALNDEEKEIAESEKEMIASVVELRDTLVREVMVPRIDIVSISQNMTLPEALNVILEAGHSRIPVYDDNIDSIVGLLYAKDILSKVRDEQLDDLVREVMREPYFVPASKKLNTMFYEFQTKHIHMAIVVDEFGGTAGLVTIEDLMEEIFGEIQDEYDPELQPEMTKISDDHFRFDARFNLDDAARILSLDLPVDIADTMGGFIFSQLGRVPQEKDEVTFENWLFKVTKIEASRIKMVEAERKTQVTMA